MNALDVLIILMACSSLVRSFEIGFARQLFSTAGFFGGLFLGAFLQQFTVQLADSPLSRSLITISTTLGCAFLFLATGEVIGVKLKSRIAQVLHLHKLDGYLGSVVGALTLVISAWLAASILISLPVSAAQTAIRESTIMNTMDRKLPPAPDIIAGLGSLIDPNGFPQVFTGSEPDHPENTVVPGISPGLQRAIDRTKASVVKVEGLGCGGVVNGTGFVISRDPVATNAHVIAGVRKPYVTDTNGQHTATPVWFDSDLDFAIVRVPNLAGAPLQTASTIAQNRTPAAVLGYPGGGGLTAGGATVIDDFTATGRDIYGRGLSDRDVYSLATRVQPGNSGGPVINAEGTVIGVIFAQSTTYDTVGYALTTPQITQAINHAQAQNRAVATGSCAR